MDPKVTIEVLEEIRSMSQDLHTTTKDDQITTNMGTNMRTSDETSTDMKVEVPEQEESELKRLQQEIIDSSIFDIDNSSPEEVLSASKIMIDEHKSNTPKQENQDGQKKNKGKQVEPITYSEAMKAHNNCMTDLPEILEQIDKGLRNVLPYPVPIEERQHLLLMIKALRKIYKFDKLHESYLDLSCRDLSDYPKNLTDEELNRMIEKVNKLAEVHINSLEVNDVQKAQLEQIYNVNRQIEDTFEEDKRADKIVLQGVRKPNQGVQQMLNTEADTDDLKTKCSQPNIKETNIQWLAKVNKTNNAHRIYKKAVYKNNNKKTM
ncbi:7104_t:CDS:2 [Gigaspora margarita]|uniref:7104_t:CDS:1 n=1 Tax=Gigaspora margarita TaxID=4874 RepID=A0ABN7UQX8_GIGMA|nr:7104_t:CDS:2 [Gigaspora margarita]